MLTDQVQESLSKFHAAKTQQKLLRDTVESLSVELVSAAADLKTHPEGFNASSLVDIARATADVVACLSEVRDKINTLTYELRDVRGLAGIVDDLLKS